MKVYRIEREKYLETTLKGFGAASAEGYRWNSINTFLVYTAESRALATLEVSVHLDFSEDLPNNWDIHPPSLETQYIGDEFVKDNEAAVLKVPSCIVPSEYNFLINPNHPDAKKITVVSIKQLTFDQRFKQDKLK